MFGQSQGSGVDSGLFSLRVGFAEAGADRIRGLCIRPEAVVPLAALVSVQESMDDPDLNFGTSLEGVHQEWVLWRNPTQVRQVIFASSSAVYGDPLNCR
ncbi:MAG: hypothetical protein M2R45_03660 [Verrucomicrobia subdivision 3 bacterium]|nr:hypothetical protein [Limisphaerales bacterium]MCS1412711.1 hypothetical protein [Limisphaerales bacterium]